MTSKRQASSDLNQDNWADEDEKEDFGSFKQASSEQLASRQIKKARRRGVVDSPAPNIFKGLSGFTGFGAASTASPPSFSFLDKKSSSDTTKKPAFEFSSGETAKTPSFDFLAKPADSKPSDSEKVSKDVQSEKVDSSKTNGINGVSPTPPPPGSNALFLSNLKSLNTGVLQWVKQHLEKSPYVNLTTVFDDYKKHFLELKKKYPNDSESEGENDLGKAAEKDVVNEKENKPLVFGGSTTLTFGSSAAKDKSPEASKPAFSFGSTVSAPSENSQESSKPLFSFGSTAAAGDKSPSKKMFSFGGSSTTENKGSKLFSFGSSTTASVFDSSKKAGGGFSFAGATPAASTPAASDEKKNEDEPSDEPPKIEVKEVKEEDSLYDKKCKLYYMNEGSYVEKGVGTVFLKAVGDDGNKTQLLIRAFTNLGNILLNIILNESTPVVRAGKNGVIVACIPNPPLDGKTESKDPVKMLIKVKTGDDADELHKKIEELKK